MIDLKETVKGIGIGLAAGLAGTGLVNHVTSDRAADREFRELTAKYERLAIPVEVSILDLSNPKIARLLDGRTISLTAEVREYPTRREEMHGDARVTIYDYKLHDPKNPDVSMTLGVMELERPGTITFQGQLKLKTDTALVLNYTKAVNRRE